MKRRPLPLLLSLCLVCSLLPSALAEEEEISSLTALCVSEPGQSAFLDAEELQILCRQATGHDLESVTFPNPYTKAGSLTCKGERLSPDITYYPNQAPQLSQILFTPNSRFTGQGEISFSLTSVKDETVSGTLLLYVPKGPDLILSMSQGASMDVKALDELCVKKTGSPLRELTFDNINRASLAYGKEGTDLDYAANYYVKPSSEEELALSQVTLKNVYAAHAFLTVKGYSVEGERFSAKVRLDMTGKDATIGGTQVKAGECVYVGGEFHSPVTVTFTLPSSSLGALWLDYGSSTARKILPEETLYPDQEPNLVGVDFVPAGNKESVVYLDYTSKGGLQGVITLCYTEEKNTAPVSSSLRIPAGSSRVNLSSVLSSACDYRGLGRLETVTFNALPDPELGIIQSGPSPVVMGEAYPYNTLGFAPGEVFRRELTVRYTGLDSRGFSYPGTLTLSLEYPHGNRFQDLEGWEWASYATEFLDSKGAVSYDSSDPSFRPGDHATRMELIYALVQVAYSNPESVPVPAFSDLPADKDLSSAAAMAAAHGLLLGDEENRMLPDSQVTRQDALVLLHRALTDLGRSLPDPGDLSSFSDAGDLASYAREAAAVLSAKGILRGDGSGKLNPLSPITRAEMASLLYLAFGE